MIKLRVGDYCFRTTKSTLIDARYFEPFFGGPMRTEPDEEVVYFVDADGDQFEHSK